jgi:hypothetical protein
VKESLTINASDRYAIAVIEKSSLMCRGGEQVVKVGGLKFFADH